MDRARLTHLVTRFLSYPWTEKRRAIRNRFKQAWNRVVPGVDLPMRLPFGAWWLAGDDVCSDRIFAGRFEPDEIAFVSAYLRAGMHVLDIGAHHGLYTVLSAKRVGPSGHVTSFEPSSRERARLELHLRLNRLGNVRVEPVALGSQAGEVDLFRVDGRETGFNSLRRPEIAEPTSAHRVPIRVLDEVIGDEPVDFIKIDVEGGELEVFRGATKLLARKPRPVILAEVSDLRAEPWGYAAREVIDFLADLGYAWYAIGPGGRLTPAPLDGRLHDNFVAAAPERRALLDVAE